MVAIDGFQNIPTFSRKIIFAENVDPKFLKLNTGDSVWVKSVSLCDNGAFTVELKEDEKVKFRSTFSSINLKFAILPHILIPICHYISH